MTAYRYRALNTDGKLTKGVIEGDSERQVRAQLRGQSLQPVEITEANTSLVGARTAKTSLFAPRVSVGDLALMTRQLATLVASNLPLDEALQAAAEQSRSGKNQRDAPAGALARCRRPFAGQFHGRVSAGL